MPPRRTDLLNDPPALWLSLALALMLAAVAFSLSRGGLVALACGCGLCLLLGGRGHEVRMAYDGLEALDAARAFRPEAVLLDIGLPGLDGLQVARRLRQEPGLEGVLLVTLSGYGTQDDHRRSREAGCDAHLVKPVDPEVLLGMFAAGR